MTQRVALFIDYQNVYKGARDCFHGGQSALSSYGQIKPDALARLLISRPQPPGEREIVSVRVYMGRPSQQRDAKGYAASRRQIAEWEKRGILVYPRTLRYPSGQPPQEKGIDVSLAIDFVAGAVDGAFDVGIIFSTDTDLVPALEFVCNRPQLNVKPEVAAWWTDGANSPLKVPGDHIWTHRLVEADYNRVRDWTVYVKNGDVDADRAGPT